MRGALNERRCVHKQQQQQQQKQQQQQGAGIAHHCVSTVCIGAKSKLHRATRDANNTSSVHQLQGCLKRCLALTADESCVSRAELALQTEAPLLKRMPRTAHNAAVPPGRPQCEQCTKTPSFALFGQRALRCAAHKGPACLPFGFSPFDRHGLCCTDAAVQLAYPSAFLHSTGMVCVTSGFCSKDGCLKTPYYARKGCKAIRCSLHKEKYHVNVVDKRRCLHDGCEKKASFSLPGERPEYCGSHKLPHMLGLAGQAEFKRQQAAAPSAAAAANAGSAASAANSGKLQPGAGSDAASKRVVSNTAAARSGRTATARSNTAAAAAAAAMQDDSEDMAGADSDRTLSDVDDVQPKHMPRPQQRQYHQPQQRQQQQQQQQQYQQPQQRPQQLQQQQLQQQHARRTPALSHSRSHTAAAGSANSGQTSSGSAYSRASSALKPTTAAGQRPAAASATAAAARAQPVQVPVTVPAVHASTQRKRKRDSEQSAAAADVAVQRAAAPRPPAAAATAAASAATGSLLSANSGAEQQHVEQAIARLATAQGLRPGFKLHLTKFLYSMLSDSA
eukprot:3505-Heterococcus_DN1.PRE.2